MATLPTWLRVVCSRRTQNVMAQHFTWQKSRRIFNTLTLRDLRLSSQVGELWNGRKLPAFSLNENKGFTLAKERDTSHQWRSERDCVQKVKATVFRYELHQRLHRSRLLFVSHVCVPVKLPHPQNLCQPVSTNRESNTGSKMRRRATRCMSKRAHLLSKISPGDTRSFHPALD